MGIDEFKQMQLKLQRLEGNLKNLESNISKPPPQNEAESRKLYRERLELERLTQQKNDLLKRIQQLKKDLDRATKAGEEEKAIRINRELVTELGNLKSILERERKKKQTIRDLE